MKKLILKKTAICLFVLAVLSQPVWAFSPEMKRSMVTGPWELVVKSDMKSAGFAIPIIVPDEDKPAEIDKMYPIIGSAKKIKVETYYPNYQWKTVPTKYDGPGAVAKLAIEGPRLDKNKAYWLTTEDAARSVLSSPVGSVAIKKLYSADKGQEMIGQLLKPGSLGVISVKLDDKVKPLQFVIKNKFQTKIPGTDYKLKILKYVPHYTIDKKSKKVYSQTDQHVNPAILVQISKGFKKYEQWIWAQTGSPHMKDTLPYKVSFTDFDLNLGKGRYILAVGSPDKTWLISNDGKKNFSQPAEVGKSYPFVNEQYSFAVSQVLANTVLKDEWYNKSDSLESPVLIVTISDGDKSEQMVLPLNKAQQTSDKTGNAVVTFRKKMPAQMGE
jgi:hypothetical protein